MAAQLVGEDLPSLPSRWPGMMNQQTDSQAPANSLVLAGGRKGAKKSKNAKNGRRRRSTLLASSASAPLPCWRPVAEVPFAPEKLPMLVPVRNSSKTGGGGSPEKHEKDDKDRMLEAVAERKRLAAIAKAKAEAKALAKAEGRPDPDEVEAERKRKLRAKRAKRRKRRQGGVLDGKNKAQSRSAAVSMRRGQQFLRNTFCLWCGTGPYPLDCGCRWIDPFLAMEKKIEELKAQLNGMSFAVRQTQGHKCVTKIEALLKAQKKIDRSPQHRDGCDKHDHWEGRAQCHGRCHVCWGCNMGDACDHFNPSGGPTHPTADNLGSIPPCTCDAKALAKKRGKKKGKRGGSVSSRSSSTVSGSTGTLQQEQQQQQQQLSRAPPPPPRSPSPQRTGSRHRKDRSDRYTAAAAAGGGLAAGPEAAAGRQQSSGGRRKAGRPRGGQPSSSSSSSSSSPPGQGGRRRAAGSPAGGGSPQIQGASYLPREPGVALSSSSSRLYSPKGTPKPTTPSRKRGPSKPW